MRRKQWIDELQFCFYAKKNAPVLTENRNPHNLDCVEMNLPFRADREMLLKALYQIMLDDEETKQPV